MSFSVDIFFTVHHQNQRFTLSTYGLKLSSAKNSSNNLIFMTAQEVYYVYQIANF